MINISVIVNDNFYKKVVGSSIHFTSVIGATEILNSHTNIFSIVKPGIVCIKINGNDKDLNFYISDGLISFINGNEATLITKKLFDLNIMTADEKKSLIEKIQSDNISNCDTIIKKINDL
jgi:F0F1-type ATP synthase epsilon subunit